MLFLTAKMFITVATTTKSKEKFPVDVTGLQIVCHPDCLTNYEVWSICLLVLLRSLPRKVSVVALAVHAIIQWYLSRAKGYWRDGDKLLACGCWSVFCIFDVLLPIGAYIRKTWRGAPGGCRGGARQRKVLKQTVQDDCMKVPSPWSSTSSLSLS